MFPEDVRQALESTVSHSVSTSTTMSGASLEANNRDSDWACFSQRQVWKRVPPAPPNSDRSVVPPNGDGSVVPHAPPNRYGSVVPPASPNPDGSVVSPAPPNNHNSYGSVVPPASPNSYRNVVSPAPPANELYSDGNMCRNRMEETVWMIPFSILYMKDFFLDYSC